jgi:hypothetical protein
VRALLERHPGSSTTEAIEYAIREHLAADAEARIRTLRGKLDIEDVSRESRAPGPATRESPTSALGYSTCGGIIDHLDELRRALPPWRGAA